MRDIVKHSGIIIIFLIIGIFSFGFLAGCATGSANSETISFEQAIQQSAADITEKLPKGARVAIVDFTSENVALSDYIKDELTGALVNGNIEVADRRNLAFVYNELNFQMSGNVSDETAVSIGKFLGAQYVVFGQLVPTGSTDRYRISSVNVETAVNAVSTMLTIRNDSSFKKIAAAVKKNQTANPVTDTGNQPAVGGSAGSFLDRGILFALRGDYELAITEFTDAINLDGNLASAWLLRGRAYSASVSRILKVEKEFSDFIAMSNAGGTNLTAEQKNGYAKAISDFTKAISLDPNLESAYRDRGVAYSYSGDIDKALDDFNHALRLNPNDAVVYRERGNIYGFKGDYDRCLADYNRAISIKPNDGTLYVNRANEYDRRGDSSRAKNDYDRAIKLDPNDMLGYANRGLWYLNNYNYEAAINDLTKAISFDIGGYDRVYFWRGLAHLNGAAQFNDFINSGIEQKIIFNYISVHQQLQAAIDDFTQYINLAPDDAIAYLNRGLAYQNLYNNGFNYGSSQQEQSENINLAFENLNKALSIDPNNPTIQKFKDYFGR